jgi:hypothetical protein
MAGGERQQAIGDCAVGDMENISQTHDEAMDGGKNETTDGGSALRYSAFQLYQQAIDQRHVV